MKREKVLLLTLCIIIIGLIITGCGGGSDNVINPSSISNQNDNNPENSGNYITIRIKWHQEGSSENCIISSDNAENTLTASMAEGVTKIAVKIREASDPNDPNAPPDDPNSYLEHGYGEITPPDEKITLGPFSGLKPIMVRVECYDTKGLLSVAEKEQQLRLSQHEISLDLGATNTYIRTHPIFLEIKQIEEPGDLPLKKGETCIKTKIVLESDDLLPKPTATPFIPRENNTIQSQESVGIENIKVRYTILGGYGALTPDGITYSNSVTTLTDYNGLSRVKLRADSHLDITLLYEFFMDRNNPDTVTNSYIFTETIYGRYYMEVLHDPPNIHVNETSTVTFGLSVDYSDFPNYYIPPAAAQNKKIFFRVIDPNGGGYFDPTEAITGNDGICSTLFKLLVENTTVTVRYIYPLYPEQFPNSPYYYLEARWVPETTSGKFPAIESSGNKTYTVKEIKRGFISFDENNNEVIEELPDPNIPLQIQN